jgi:Tfp pilus assembly protein FimT
MKRREKGLTLIELMVTLAVAIVILAIGIPAFNAMSARDMSAAAVNALVTALTQARVAASSGVGSASVCAAATTTTSSTCGAASNWTNGWLVFLEPSFAVTAQNTQVMNVPNGVIDTGTDELVRRFDPVRAQIGITTTAAIVSFRGTGEATAATPITFDIKAYSDSSKTKCVRWTQVTVTPTGQIIRNKDSVSC